MTPEERLRDFVSLVESGRSLDAIDRYYADDVIVSENHERARIGKAACLAFERDALAESPSPKARAHAAAIDPRSGRSFVEWTIRFSGRDGRPMRLDEVAVQVWASGRIVEERFYYEGIIDEGDPDPEPEGETPPG